MVKSSRGRALICAGAIATSLLGAIPQSFAQVASAEKSRTYEIPAGPLATALNRFASESGLALVYPAELTRGRQTAGISGSHNDRTALAQLLTGTNLTFRFTNQSTVVIEAARAEQSDRRVLGPVRVEGVTAGSRRAGVTQDVTATEGSGTYAPRDVKVGSKSAQPFTNVPQSVSVITNRQIEDQNLYTIGRVLEQTTGVTVFADQEAGNIAPGFHSRGYALQNFQLDGGAVLPQSGGPIIFPDFAIYDHVEVLRGADGLFSGSGDPSGTVNLVRKRPLDHAAVSIEGAIGSWQNQRAEVDANGILSEKHSINGRLIVAKQERDYFYDVTHYDMLTLYGVAEKHFGDSTSLRAGLTKSDSSTDGYWRRGLYRRADGANLQFPRDTALTLPWSRYELQSEQLFIAADHRLAENVSLSFKAELGEYDDVKRTGENDGVVDIPGGAYDDPAYRIIKGRRDDDSSSTSRTADLHASGDFELLGRTHLITVGGSYSRGTNQSRSSSIEQTFPIDDVMNFDPDAYPDPGNPGPYFRGEGTHTQYGLYVRGDLHVIPKWHVLYGQRLSYVKTSSRLGIGTQFEGESSDSDSGISVPYYSLRFDATENMSLFGTYTNIFQVQSRMFDVNLKPLEPLRGNDLQIGAKYSALNGNLTASLAYYRIEKRNVAVAVQPIQYGCPGPFDTCYYTSSDAAERSQGFDIEVAGEPFEGLNLVAGYTYNENQRFNFPGPISSITPASLFKLWANWTPGSGLLNGALQSWSFGIGLNGQTKHYQSGSVFLGDPTKSPPYAPEDYQQREYDFVQGGFVVGQISVAYDFDADTQVRLNVENVTDKVYFKSVGPLERNWYGEPRNFMLTVRRRF